jgi:ADP-L-glycero-D-manno-heptose 6-epimerase
MPDRYIIVTGAAGFIGSCMVGLLNSLGITDIIAVDDFSRSDKLPNLEGKSMACRINRAELFSWLAQEKPALDAVYHLGARTDTTEFDYGIHEKLNLDYSKKVWAYCTQNRIDLLYASSAATYGDGSKGYADSHTLVDELQPLNPYGISKNEFDKWAIRQVDQPPQWYGMKFFNVYGPNEYHKGRMASVIYHAYLQIRDRGRVDLFRSHHPDFRDGEQLRDFIYVKDVVEVCSWIMNAKPASGIYNLGTGMARSFLDLARATFAGMDLKPDIRFIDMPPDIRDKYQYFTEADMKKLRQAGYGTAFRSLEEGVGEYVREYLRKGLYY